MKKRAIWIAAAACVILLCGCSHSEEAGAYLSTTRSTVEENRGGSKINSGHSFSESKPEDAEAVKNKEPMAPAEKEESVEQPSSASAKGQTESQPGNTTSAIPASSKQPASEGPEENEPQPEAAPAQQPAEPQPPAAPAEPEQPATQPTAPTEPPTPTEPQAPAFDVSSYVGFAQSYGQGIGLSLDSTATACWDDPIAASSRSAYLERDLKDRPGTLPAALPPSAFGLRTQAVGIISSISVMPEFKIWRRKQDSSKNDGSFLFAQSKRRK